MTSADTIVPAAIVEDKMGHNTVRLVLPDCCVWMYMYNITCRLLQPAA